MNFAHFAMNWFWVLALVLIALILWHESWRRRSILQMIGLESLEKMASWQSWNRAALWKNILQGAALFFLGIALIGPEIGSSLKEVRTQGGNVYILFDVSASMMAEDFKPNRLEKSKRLLSGLLEKLSGHRVGIIVFAGAAYVYCPLTVDLSAAKQFLRSIDPQMVPIPGTQIGAAVRLALEKMKGVQGYPAIVLLTDGEDHKSDPLGAAQESAKMAVPIYTIGVGNSAGEVVPIRDGGGKIQGYKKNREGQIVLSKLDENTLAKMAVTTGGVYYQASDSELEIDQLAGKIQELSRGQKTGFQKSKYLEYENRYQWFLVLALLLFAGSEFLKFVAPSRARSIILLVAILFLSANALAKFHYRAFYYSPFINIGPNGIVSAGSSKNNTTTSPRVALG